MRLDEESIVYFKELAAETGIPYQSLINLYLRDCVVRRRRLAQRWEPGADEETSAAEFVASDKPQARKAGRATRRRLPVTSN